MEGESKLSLLPTDRPRRRGVAGGGMASWDDATESSLLLSRELILSYFRVFADRRVSVCQGRKPNSIQIPHAHGDEWGVGSRTYLFGRIVFCTPALPVLLKTSKTAMRWVPSFCRCDMRTAPHGAVLLLIEDRIRNSPPKVGFALYR